VILERWPTPALVGLAAVAVGWRATLLGLGLFGLVFSALVGVVRPWVGRLPEVERELTETRANGSRPRCFGS